MPEFYIIIARKILFPNFRPPPPSRLCIAAVMMSLFRWFQAQWMTVCLEPSRPWRRHFLQSRSSTSSVKRRSNWPVQGHRCFHPVSRYRHIGVMLSGRWPSESNRQNLVESVPAVTACHWLSSGSRRDCRRCGRGNCALRGRASVVDSGCLTQQQLVASSQISTRR